MKPSRLFGKFPSWLYIHAIVPLIYRNNIEKATKASETWISAIKGILVAIIAVVIGLIYLLVARTASADILDLKPLTYTPYVKNGFLVDYSVGLLLEKEIDSYSHFCYASPVESKSANEINNHLTSNIFMDTTFYKHDYFEFHIHVQHHSCAFGIDAPDYNAIGAGIVFRFNR